MAEANAGIRKGKLEDAGAGGDSTYPGEIDVAAAAVVSFSAEDSAHPVEHMLDRQGGRGATRWRSNRDDTTEQIVFDFDAPQPISRLIYEVDESESARTQEVRVEVSTDGGASYRQILAQDYNFSPGGATFQHEDLRFELAGVSNLRLTIVPNKGGSGRATLSSFRLCA